RHRRARTRTGRRGTRRRPHRACSRRSRAGPAPDRQGRIDMRSTASFFVAVALGLGACAAPGRVPTCHVERRAFVREIVADGYLSAVVSTKVMAPADAGAMNLDWIIDDGTPVKKGDVIARFDETPWRKELDSANNDGGKARLKSERHGVARQVD